MRLKTKLVLATTALTTAIVLVLSTMFLGELMRQRIEQTASSNEVLVHEVLLMTRQTVESGLREHPPTEPGESSFEDAVAGALRTHGSLMDVMQAIVRYSPTVQDVSVTRPDGRILVSTDPDSVDTVMRPRFDLLRIRDESVYRQTRQVFGKARVLDLTEPLDRNGRSFLIVHVGVRSSFVRASYEPWLKAALLFALLAAAGAMVAAGLLASAVLRPIERINERLATLAGNENKLPAQNEVMSEPRDAVVRMTQTIDRLDAQMRSTEAGYTTLRANVNQMLETLRDGVLLFGEDGRAAMVSGAATYFLNRTEKGMVGRTIEEIFVGGTALGDAVLWAYGGDEPQVIDRVPLEDGRIVQFSVEHIGAGTGREMGTLVRLRDMESAAQLEKELEVSRRLAAVGRLTAGVGHEVKNPINAMVVHLELLKSKLAVMDKTASAGAQRHVDILAGEMRRLDRVVETLADFSRPMELHLTERSILDVIDAVVELTEAEMDENGVRILIEAPREPLLVRIDGELIRQALLNLVLNGMQAMPGGGILRLSSYRDKGDVVVEVADAGDGIAEDILPRIFDLYFTTKAKGSGIGLAMTYRIVQMHGGSMDVSSTTAEQADGASGLSKGTLFTVRLPTSAVIEVRKRVGSGNQGRRPAGEIV